MSWANMSNDPSTDERVLKDAQRTIERIVEAMKTALDDELAVQQMEYDQVYGVNSMQFAMYQTLVMTFFQDHQMIAGLNLKRSRPDLSHGVPEQKRAYLMEVIAERVSSAAPPAVQPQPQTGVPNPGMPGAAAWQQQPQPAAQAPAANWLDPQPAAPAQPSPGDWLNQPAAKERPPATAWPTNEDSSTWTLKPGGGQPPPIPANSGNGSSGAAWSAASNSWPTPEDQKQGQSSSGWPTVPETAQVIQSENKWSGAQTGSPGWADQPGSKQAPPAAAWPASNSGAAPAPTDAVSMPQPPVAPQGVVRPNFNTPIGESGLSGTWTIPPKPADPPAPAWDSSGKPGANAAPPAPAWGEPSAGAPQSGSNGNYSEQSNQPAPGQVPAAAWSPPSTPSQEMSAWNQPAPAPAPTQGLAATPPAPAWSAPGGAMPTPEGSSNQTTQPWQNPASGGPQQPWQPEQPQPAWQAPPASITQSGLPAQPAAVSPPAWEAPPASITQPQPAPQQPWQSPPANQPWQQPAPQAPQQMQQPLPMQQPLVSSHFRHNQRRTTRCLISKCHISKCPCKVHRKCSRFHPLRCNRCRRFQPVFLPRRNNRAGRHQTLPGVLPKGMARLHGLKTACHHRQGHPPHSIRVTTDSRPRSKISKVSIHQTVRGNTAIFRPKQHPINKFLPPTT